MDLRTWPEQDEKWIARYRSSIAYKHVPSAVVEARERELLDTINSTGQRAVELFGDPSELAAEDSADLATVQETVRRSEGGGLRSSLFEVGQSLTGIAAVNLLIMLARAGWSTDIQVKEALVVAGIVVLVVGGVVGRALFVAGRPVAMIGVLAAAVVTAGLGLAWAVRIPDGAVLADGVPVLVLGGALLVPGVVLLVVASRMPPQTLREDWTDEEWLGRFRGGLRSRLVPTDAVRGHVQEVQQTLDAGGASAFAEFGHPLVLSRELAAADRTARSRRWWWSTVGGGTTTMAIAAVILGLGSWGALTIPLGGALLLSATATLVIGWRNRPWAVPR